MRILWGTTKYPLGYRLENGQMDIGHYRSGNIIFDAIFSFPGIYNIGFWGAILENFLNIKHDVFRENILTCEII